MIVLVAVPYGCAMCNDAGCSSGVDVEILAASGEAIEPGTYDVHVEADDLVLDATCIVADLVSASTCEVEVTQGDVDSFDIGVFGPGGPPVIERPNDLPRGSGDGPVVAFFLHISDERTKGTAIEHTGPNELSIRIVRDDVEVFAEDLEPDYEREHHRGSDRCGFCDYAAIDFAWPADHD
jgi:hypothetical protein